MFEASQQQEGLQSTFFLRAPSLFHCKHLARLESILLVQIVFFITSTVVRQADALPCLSVEMDISCQLLGSLKDSNKVTGGSSCGSFSAFITGCRWIFTIDHVFHNLSVAQVNAVLVRAAEFDSRTLNTFSAAPSV